MRVLHLTAGNMYGGVERMLVTLARFRHLTPEVDIEFGFCFRGRGWDELAARGVRLHDLGPVRLSRPWRVWRARRRLTGVLAAGRYDAVLVHSLWPLAVFGPAARRGSSALGLWLHDPPEDDRRVNLVERYARRVRIDFAVCNSRHTRDRFPRLYPDVPAEIIHCPVNPPAPPAEPRAAVRAKFATPAAAAVVLQVGRWEPHKGHLHLMRALGRLRDRPGWVCWQVGVPQRPYEARYEQEVRAEAARQGVADRVHFLGWQPDLDSVLAAADVYCQPNVRPEPFGIAVIEAMGAGLPVVATALGGVKETVTPDCGVLVPPGDPAALAAAVGGLLADPARRVALAAGGPARAVAVSDPGARLRELAGVLARYAGRPTAGAIR